MVVVEILYPGLAGARDRFQHCLIRDYLMWGSIPHPGAILWDIRPLGARGPL